MTERDEWHPSLLSCVGALTDTSTDDWVYIARYYTLDSEHAQGVLCDVPANEAYTRAEAIIRGREIAEEKKYIVGSDVVEEWAYTTEEAKNITYRTRTVLGPEQEQDDCGCGGK